MSFAAPLSLRCANLANIVDFRPISVGIWLFSGPFPVLRAQLSCSSGQLLAHDVDIGQGELAENLLVVLVQSAITGPGVAELALDDPDMLDLGAERRRQPVDPALFIGQGLALLALEGRGPDDVGFGSIGFERTLIAGIGAVAKGNFLLAVKQGIGRHAIMHIGRCHFGRMHAARSRVCADMRLHAEIPLIALPGLLYLGIARLRAVLGRWRRGDQSRIHDRALAQQQTALGQNRRHLVKQRFAQFMLLKQMPELQDRRLVGYALEVEALQIPATVASPTALLPSLDRTGQTIAA